MAIDVAIISHEPTPYRLHVLRRLARELDDIRVHNIFTHRLHDASMPWNMEVGEELRPVFFQSLALGDHERDLPRQRKLFAEIQAYLQQQGVRMIVLLGYNDWTRIQLIRWARDQRIPLLLNADSNVFGEGRLGWAKRAVKRRLIRWVVANVAGLMPMGVCGRAYFRVYADHRKPCFLMPYEPDYDALQQCPREEIHAFLDEHGLAAERKRLLFCGRFVPIKGVEVLLDAFARIADQRPAWDLVLAGDGPLRPQVQQKIAGPLADRVYLPGFLQFEQTRACYHGCDVLVHPSEYEPWALVINEAVACGLPIVTTEVVGAAAELVRHNINGLLVAPGDRDGLADAMLKATEPERLAAMAAATQPVLKAWRAAADPVNAVRDALDYFRVR